MRKFSSFGPVYFLYIRRALAPPPADPRVLLLSTNHTPLLPPLIWTFCPRSLALAMGQMLFLPMDPSPSFTQIVPPTFFPPARAANFLRLLYFFLIFCQRHGFLSQTSTHEWRCFCCVSCSKSFFFWEAIFRSPLPAPPPCWFNLNFGRFFLLFCFFVSVSDHFLFVAGCVWSCFAFPIDPHQGLLTLCR